MYQSRIALAQEVVREHQLAALIIGTGPEFAYFTGSWVSSHERLTCLIITAHGAEIIAPMTDIASLEDAVGWQDGENPYDLVAGKIPAGDVALGSSLTADHVLALQQRIDGSTRPLPSGLFQVKEDWEIKQLRIAGAAIDRVHAAVPELLKPGRTEAEVAAEINHLILADHVVVDFVIVGSGPNGANPHHSFSSRILNPGDPVVVDIGGTLDSGYHSDSTRTYVVPGALPSDEFLHAYKAVHAGYSAAIDRVAEGVTAQQIDQAARFPITEAGYGEYFTHRTGHGIGLSTHEEPFIVAGNNLELEKGMAFSIEPGVYLPGQWGIRIEDIVVVADPVERLNLQPTELL